MKNNVISGGTAFGTFIVGLGNLAEMIPEGIGKIACVVGIFGTLTVILVNMAKFRKLDIEIRRLKKLEDGTCVISKTQNSTAAQSVAKE